MPHESTVRNTNPRPRLGAGAKAALDGRDRMAVDDVATSAGPGVISGGADNDPAGVTTYAVVGAQTGYAQNWLLLLSTPMMVVVQEMSARVGNVTKGDLGTAIRTHYGSPIAALTIGLFVLVNLLVLGADLLMTATAVGMLISVRPTYVVLPLATALGYVTIFWDYRKFSRLLLWVVGLFVSYIVAAVLAHPDWRSVLAETFVPHIRISSGYVVAAVGLLGATLTPYCFFWQTSGELEERRGVQSIPRTSLDVFAGMIWSQISAYFIIVATGAVLFVHHVGIHSATDAAQALQPFVGPYAKYLFALGMVGSGLLAVPVLATSTAYAVGSLFRWRRSLSETTRGAPQFYLVIAVAMLIGSELAISDVNPIDALFYSQVLAGFVSPLLVVFLLLLTTSRKVMGDFAVGTVTRVIGWATLAVLIAADVGLIYTLLTSGLPS